MNKFNLLKLLFVILFLFLIIYYINYNSYESFVDRSEITNYDCAVILNVNLNQYYKLNNNYPYSVEILGNYILLENKQDIKFYNLAINKFSNEIEFCNYSIELPKKYRKLKDRYLYNQPIVKFKSIK